MSESNIWPGSYPTLSRPPIVQAWIEFEFEPSPNKQASWFKDVTEFFSQYSDDFPKQEIIEEHRLNIRKTARGAKPELVNEVVIPRLIRVHNEEGTRWLQVANDQLLYNVVQPGADYCGFDILLNESISKLRDYLGYFHPAVVRQTAVHYVDVVEIPMGGHQEASLSDYFRIAVDLPKDPFGMTTAFATQFVLCSSVDDGPLHIRLQSLPPSNSDDHRRFRIDWHKISQQVNSLKLEEIRRRLRSARDYIRQCFDASFTQCTWRIFNSPKLENE